MKKFTQGLVTALSLVILIVVAVLLGTELGQRSRPCPCSPVRPPAHLQPRHDRCELVRADSPADGCGMLLNDDPRIVGKLVAEPEPELKRSDSTVFTVFAIVFTIAEVFFVIATLVNLVWEIGSKRTIYAGLGLTLVALDLFLATRATTPMELLMWCVFAVSAIRGVVWDLVGDRSDDCCDGEGSGDEDGEAEDCREPASDEPTVTPASA